MPKPKKNIAESNFEKIINEYIRRGTVTAFKRLHGTTKPTYLVRFDRMRSSNANIVEVCNLLKANGYNMICPHYMSSRNHRNRCTRRRSQSFRAQNFLKPRNAVFQVAAPPEPNAPDTFPSPEGTPPKKNSKRVKKYGL